MLDARAAQLQAAWERHSIQRERSTFKTTNVLVCVLVPAWSLLDFYLEPRLATQFLALRTADVGATLLLAWLIARSSDQRGNRLRMAASIAAVGLTIVPMLAQVASADYALYALGFSLVFWGAGLLLLWPVRYAVATFALLLSAYAAAWGLTRSVPAPQFVGVLFYLSSVTVIACAQLAVRGRLERRAFEASYELGARNAELESAHAESRSKDQFLATVSHELRTPLSAILGWSKLLSLPGLEAAKRGRALETIERNAVSMAHLIDDLLDVSRIVSGKLRIEPMAIDPARVVAAAIETVRPAAEAKSIRIVQEIERYVGHVRGDAARLQQVVWNLVNNAVKFTPTDGEVRIRLRRSAGHAEIVVQDSGQGIDPRFLPHVFEPFRQADRSETRSTSGLGLGLAIVKHIVELHGGVAEAQSEGLGKGAAFTVRLPLARRSAAARSALESAPDARPERAGQLAGVRVLVVEDELDMRQFVEEVLSASGSHVDTVATVAEAMQHFERGEIPDVLISDIGMDGESGYDLIRRVRERADGDGGRVPAAALTAYTREEDRTKILSAGFELHVPKPVAPEELVSIVARLAAGSRSAARP